MKIAKRLLLIGLFLMGMNHVLFAQQWGGSATQAGNIFRTGKVGIGITSPAALLHIKGGKWFLGSSEGDFKIGNNTHRLKIGVALGGYGAGDVRIRSHGGSNRLILGSGTNDVLTVKNNSVGIGTINPGIYRLAVNGSIRAKEVIVETNWSDFVFEKDYHLMPLEDVEQYIKINKHLPDIPSEKEVASNGVKVGEMHSKLLQKIEELTLYIIEQNKRIKALEQENKSLKTHPTSMKGVRKQ